MRFIQEILKIIKDLLSFKPKEPLIMKKILLDAGHGGKDTGAVANNVEEKDITLDIVMDTGGMLGHRPDIEVYYTRLGDKSLSLISRYRAIMDINPDAFVSIHCNAILDDPSTIQDECQTVHGVEIFYRDDEDLPLANAINSLFKHSGIWKRNRGVKQDQEWLEKRLTVLNSLEVPSVLVEVGFISNRLECIEILKHEAEIAELIAHGIIDFFEKDKK